MNALNNSNIVSVSWGDHLVFGEGDGRLATPAAVQRRMQHWQKDLDGANLPPLDTDLTAAYQPVFDQRDTKLFLARQWQPRSPAKEKSLLAHPAVDGLVFSSFRHDNPGPVCRNDWQA